MKFEEKQINLKRWLKLKDLLNEEWRDIKGYEGLYQVSNYGRIKSIKNNIKILNRSLDNYGYDKRTLSKYGKAKTFHTHRLVAEAFIPNLDNKPCVNHIDGNKLNNRVDNLEWCTASENLKHAYRTNLRTNNFKGKFGKNNIHSKKIYQISKVDNKIINCFYGAREAQRITGIKSNSITMCCKNQRKTAGSYIWKYALDINL